MALRYFYWREYDSLILVNHLPPLSKNSLLTLLLLYIDIIKNYSNIIYRTSAQNVGSDASRIVPERPVLHGFNGKFSSHLGKAGMVANNGLNTHVERERVIDYSQDWVDTNI